MLVPNCVWPHSGVAGTVEGTRPDVAVAVEDLRPKAKYVNITLEAVDDIQFCEKLFDKWMIELGKCVANHFSQPCVRSTDNNGLQSQEQPHEARRAREIAEILSWAPEGTR